ncbi:hypothetical protein [Streptomyces hokutonensis]|uniref:hypothetical protein n=1 Tax=Streptomyces hokutonensis TaxID=1306990 RepID=UPI00368522E4
MFVAGQGLPQALESNAEHAADESTEDSFTLSREESAPGEELLDAIRHARLREGTSNEPVPLVPARMALLADSSYTLVPAPGSGSTLRVRLDPAGGQRAIQVLNGLLEEGDFLVLRRSSHDLYLKDRADALLGVDALRLRALQKKWKHQLWQRVSAHPQGSAGVANDLRRLGAETANVNYWTSGHCIRTRSLATFRIVLAYLGRRDEADWLWRELGRIDSAHRQAGRHFATDLERALSAVDLRAVVEHGFSEMALSVQGERTDLVRVDQILPEPLMVPSHMLCSRHTFEESQWHG